MEASRAPTTKTQIEVEWQKGLVLAALKSRNSALNDMVNLRGRVAVASRHEVKLPSSSSAALAQIAKDTAELH